MSEVIIYSKDHCPYCTMAKTFFDSRGIGYIEIRVDEDAAKRDEMIARSNRRTVPQIFINGQSIGGYDDLMALVKAGKFEALLQSSL